MSDETETEIGPAEWSEMDVTCDRCQIDVSFEEKELYLDTGLCGWCAHIVARDAAAKSIVARDRR